MKKQKRKLRIGRVVFATVLLLLIIICVRMALNGQSRFDTFEISEVQRERVYAMVEKPEAIKITEEYLSSEVQSNPGNFEQKKAEAVDRINSFRENQEYNIYKSETGGKVAYLTFDDGPSTKSTAQILDILDKEGIKATFFVLGISAENNPDMVREIYKRGHKIGNHSYSHDYKYLYASADNLISDVMKCDEVLKSILGEEYNNHIMRFPGGCFGEKKRNLKKILLEKTGFINYNWNCLNGDAEGRLFSKEHLVNRFKETKGGQEKLIILMHDTNAKSTTPEALPEIIHILKSEGYSFSVLPD